MWITSSFSVKCDWLSVFFVRLFVTLNETFCKSIKTKEKEKNVRIKCFVIEIFFDNDYHY